MLVVLQTQQANPLLVLVAVVGLAVLGFLAFANRVAVYRSFGASDDAVTPESMTNCPSCGTRVPDSDETCDHCGESFAASP